MPSRRRQIARHRGGGGVVEHKRRRHVARPLDEQLHRLERRERVCCRRASSVVGNSSDGTRQATSPGMPSGSRLVASSTQIGTARQQLRDERNEASSRCSQLSSTSSIRRPTELVGERRGRRLPSRQRQPERGCDRRRDESTVGDAGQLDEPHAVRVQRGLETARRELVRQARLARAARADQGEQSRAVEDTGQLAQLACGPRSSSRKRAGCD